MNTLGTLTEGQIQMVATGIYSLFFFFLLKTGSAQAQG